MGTEKAVRERDVLSGFYDSHNLKRSAVCGDRRASAALALAGSPPEGFARFDICSTPVPPPQLQKHCHQFYQDAHACGKFLKQVVTVHGGLRLRKFENAAVRLERNTHFCASVFGMALCGDSVTAALCWQERGSQHEESRDRNSGRGKHAWGSSFSFPSLFYFSRESFKAQSDTVMLGNIL